MKVTICARNESDLRAAEREIENATGVEILGLRADLSAIGDVKMVIRETHKVFGRIDILVNNTGGPRSARFLATTEEDWKGTFNQLFMSVVVVCYEVAPFMKKKRWGRIINMNSIAAKQPVDRLILSNSLRAGIICVNKDAEQRICRRQHPSQ